jgi:hypothetical protein
MIVANESGERAQPRTEPFAPRWREPVRRNEPIVQAVVIPVAMVMRHERVERPT